MSLDCLTQIYDSIGMFGELYSKLHLGMSLLFSFSFKNMFPWNYFICSWLLRIWKIV